MIDRIITFCLTHLDVFDGLILGILFTLLCKWLEKKFSKVQPVTVVNVGDPIDFKVDGQPTLDRYLKANRDRITKRQ